MEIRISHVLLLALALGVASLWYFGRAQPIEVRSSTMTKERNASCIECSGSGVVNCPQCGGFGSLDAQVACPTCKGTGKHQWQFREKPDAPCQKCRGTGRIDSRAKCNHCSGKGKVRCSSCGGVGKRKISSPETSRAVYMGFSLWERFLLLLHLPIDPNPCPQVDSKGEYPIVVEYVKLKSTERPCSMDKWGEFKQRGEEWVLPGTVEFTDKNGNSTSRQVEFVVTNRKLVSTRKTTRTIQ